MSNPTQEETERAVTEFVRDVLVTDGVPGLSVSLVDRNGAIFSKGFGARDLTSNEPATPATLFGIGSTTKSFTALTVQSLCDDGLMSVDDPVTDYLPVSFSEKVTIHHLLSHTSGAPSNGMANVLLSRLTDVGEIGVPMSDRADFIEHVNEAIESTIHEPGSQFFYYASGFTLLGMVIEEVTGNSYRQVVDERVLGPLGMDRSTFDRATFESTDDRMTPYAPSPDGYRKAPFPFHDLIDATGGLQASVDELSTYLRMFLNDGSVDGTTVVSPDRIDEMGTAHADTDGEMGVHGYGYGLMIDELGGRRLVGHSGDAVVSTGYVGFLPDAGYGLALGCNTSPPFKLNLLGKALLAIAVGDDPTETVPYFGRRRRFAGLTGTYEAHRGTKRVQVSQRGAQLSLELEGMVSSSTVPLVLDEATPERVRFDALQPSATPMSVEFVETDGGVDLLMERWHLHRTGSP